MDKNVKVCVTRRLLGWRGRVSALMLAMCLIAMLGTAACLKPASAGFGTHQQLGLPACSLRVLAGIRCPACGMTTSWSYFMRGQWVRSIRSNPGGFLLAGLASVVSFKAIGVSWTGRRVTPENLNWVAVGLFSALSIALIDWGLRFI